MGKYILKRLGQTLLVLFAISIIVFLLMNVLPGDPVALMLEKRADPATVEQVRHSLGLDKPLFQQYWDFLVGIFHGDLGTSYFTKEPVMETLTRSFFITLQLAACSFVFAVIIGVTCGMLAAIYRGKALDSTLMTLSIVGISAPSFWVAIILQIIFGLQLDLLPIAHLFYPAEYCAGNAVCRIHCPYHAYEHAGRYRTGLHPYCEGERGKGKRGYVEACLQERLDSDCHLIGDAAWLHAWRFHAH